jgi:hypothetical protein
MGNKLTDYIIIMALAVLLALLVLLTATLPTNAHSFYDPKCCNDADCAPVSEANLRPVKGGWRLHITPGEHPMVKQVIDVLIPYNDPKVKFSPDGRPHACIGPNTQVVFCIYVPDYGS